MRIVTHEERRTSCPALYFRRDDNLRPLSVSSRQLFPRKRPFSFRDDNVAPFTTSSPAAPAEENLSPLLYLSKAVRNIFGMFASYI